MSMVEAFPLRLHFPFIWILHSTPVAAHYYNLLLMKSNPSTPLPWNEVVPVVEVDGLA